MVKSTVSCVFWILLSVLVLTQTTQVDGVVSSSEGCKELNQVNCYVGRNEGNYCSSKNKATGEVRWYYDKGSCRQFTYRGCNGNRNRFCTKESCERRCNG